MQEARKRVAVVGAGISGLSAAWLLSRRHDVVLYDRDSRLGGHSNTVEVDGPRGPIPVDTGFIVYNELTYPNLSALFGYLGVRTLASNMSFAVSRDRGRLEYSGTGLGGLFAQRRNLASPRFWSMLRDLARFYSSAAEDLAALPSSHTLGDYLDRGRYGVAFRDDHLLPMAGAIWSAPCASILGYPASSFIRFFHNHGLLALKGRPNGGRSMAAALPMSTSLPQAFGAEFGSTPKSARSYGARMASSFTTGGMAQIVSMMW